MSASERGLEISQESVRGGVRRMLSRGGAIGGARWLFAPLKTCRIPFPQEHRSISPYCNKIGPDQAVLMSVRPSILLQFEVRKCTQMRGESTDFSKFSGEGLPDLRPGSRWAAAPATECPPEWLPPKPKQDTPTPCRSVFRRVLRRGCSRGST